MNARGTGPFMVKSYAPAVSLAAVRNPDYWVQGRPYLEGVELLWVQDEATMLAAYRVGRVDFGAQTAGAIGIEARRNLERTNPNMKFVTISDPWVVALVPNLRRKPFDNLLLRKAIFLALDRQEMVNIVVGGQRTHQRAHLLESVPRLDLERGRASEARGLPSQEHARGAK